MLRVLARRPEGETYLVEDRGVGGRNGVLKLRLSESVDLALGQSVADAPRRRAEALAQVKSRSIAVPYTFGVLADPRVGSFYYSVREYSDGTSLSELPRPQSAAALVEIASQVGSALSVLHAAGQVHGDLKCENIVVQMPASGEVDRQSRCVLIDLAEGFQVDDRSALSEVSLQYLAPELARGVDPSAQSDLFALGVTLYLTATGQLPYKCRSVSQLIAAQRNREFTPVRLLAPSVPEPIRELIDRLLEPSPANRCDSALEVVESMSDLRGGCSEARRQGPAIIDGLWIESNRGARQVQVLLAESACFKRMSPVAIVGPRNSGVTTQLRHVQDALERDGTITVAASPRLRSRGSIADQLGSQFAQCLRSRSRAARMGDNDIGRRAAQVLDDAHALSLVAELAVFVDDAALLDPDELRLVARLAGVGRSQSGGSMRLYLGASGDFRETIRLIASEIGCPLAEYPVVPVESSALRSAIESWFDTNKFGISDCDRLIAATDGRVGDVLSLFGRVLRNQDLGLSVTGSIESAITAVQNEGSPSVDAAEREIHHYARSRAGMALLALTAWGEPVSESEWGALLVELGVPDFASILTREDVLRPLLRREQGKVESAAVHLAAPLWGMLSSGFDPRITAGLYGLVREYSRSSARSKSQQVVRFVSRLGHVPDQLRWPVLRAMIRLLRWGHAPEVRSALARLSASVKCSQGWLAALAWGLGILEDKHVLNAGLGMLEYLRPQLELWTRIRAGVEVDHPTVASVLQVPSTGLSACHASMLEDACEFAARRNNLRDTVALASALRAKLNSRSRGPSATPGERSSSSGHCRPWLGRNGYLACQVLRADGRVARLSGDYGAMKRKSEHESAIARSLGYATRMLAAASNAAACDLALGDSALAAHALERCVDVCERLDDDDRLASALQNLFVARSRSGHASQAIAALNRLRLVAARAGLDDRLRAANYSLAAYYARLGRLREAFRGFSQVGSTCGDDVAAAGLRMRSQYSAAALALDLSYADVAHRFLASIRSGEPSIEMMSQATVLATKLESRLHLRNGNWRAAWKAIESCHADLAGDGDSEILALADEIWIESSGAYGASLPSESARGLPVELRLHRLCFRWSAERRRVGEASLERLLRVSSRTGTARPFLRLAYHALRNAHADSAASLADAVQRWMATPWLIEGHHDLRALITAELAAHLARAGRAAEADALIATSIELGGMFERRSRRCGASSAIVARMASELERIARQVCVDVPRRISARVGRVAGLLFKARRGAIAAKSGHLRVAGVSAHKAIADAAARSNPIERMLRVIVDATGADRCLLVERFGDELSIRARADRVAVSPDRAAGDVDLSWAIVSEVTRRGQARVFGDALSDDELTGHRSIEQLALRSVACVPVRHAGLIVGALYLDHQSTAGLFSPALVELIEVAAGTVGAISAADSSEKVAAAATARLSEAETHLIRAERDRFAGEMVSGKAHDLKNILTSIAARGQLAAGYDSLEKMRSALRSIDHAAKAAAELIRKMHECSMEHEHQERESVRVEQLVADVLEILEPRVQRAASSGCPIRLNVSGDESCVIDVVPGEMREALLNILVNACDAMPDGGEIDVDVRADVRTQRVVVRVSDTGAGVAPEILDRLFDPFFTTKGKNGTGLGLAIVRRVVVACGGDVRFEPNRPRGSTVLVELPMAGGANRDSGVAREIRGVPRALDRQRD